MRTSEIHVSKPEIIETNRMSDQKVLDKLKNGGWVDAGAAMRAIGRRDETWNPGRQRHRGEAQILEFKPLPLEDNLRPEGTRRERPPSHAHSSLD